MTDDTADRHGAGSRPDLWVPSLDLSLVLKACGGFKRVLDSQILQTIA